MLKGKIGHWEVILSMMKVEDTLKVGCFWLLGGRMLLIV